MDLFIRDLDTRQGKLPCCQEVTDIQTSVENILKALLVEVEKENPFYKTTLINSGSFYEGTKVGKPDEFDYFVQLDNFSEPTDIQVEELPCSTVMVIPSESGFQKFLAFRKAAKSYCYYFDWKQEVKAPFVGILGSKIARGFEAYGMKVAPSWPRLSRHGPAYSLTLQWEGGERYKGLEITVDLSLAVKISSHSSTMDVEFQSTAGKVVKSLLDSLPYYFAVSAYRDRETGLLAVEPPSKLFIEFEDSQNHSFSVSSPSDCYLRCSQSCLEQSLFRHFGPDSGPSVCLRVLKVLRDMTLLLRLRDTVLPPIEDFACIDNCVAEFNNTRTHLRAGSWMWSADLSSLLFIDDKKSNSWISSYVLKTLVLFEWENNPESKQWTGSSLSERLLAIIKNLLDCLVKSKHESAGLRSFFYKDYCVLPLNDKVGIREAINRTKIILKCLLSIRSSTNYCFEGCLQNVMSEVMLSYWKNKLTWFLKIALESIFADELRTVVPGSTSKTKNRSVL